MTKKEFATLAAEYALAGHSLIRTQPAEGQAPYYAGRWGQIKPLHSYQDALKFLDQIRGAV